MMMDHTKKLREDLAEHASSACDALDLMRTTDPLDEEKAWVQALNDLNRACVAFQMIGEQMHDELCAWYCQLKALTSLFFRKSGEERRFFGLFS